jgi:hypothetical protein
MSKKSVDPSKRYVIGIDETNNGFDLAFFNPHYKPAIIMTGYLAEDRSMKGYHHCQNEVKQKLFNGERNIHLAISRARQYLRDHPDFLYTSISKDFQKSSPLEVLKAEAASVLAINFFLRYDLDVSKTSIVMDQMDKLPSKSINTILDLWLRKAHLVIPHNNSTVPYDSIPHFHRKSGASHVLAVRKADMVGYYLAALRLLGDHPNWPYKHNRVGLKTLEHSVVKLLEEQSYLDFPTP